MVKTRQSAGLERCPWCTADPLYVSYHDEEWGVPEKDERALFERLILEGMQAGLSWLTILKKRAHMVERFSDFEPAALAQTGETEIVDWLTDPGIIRHRGKLEAMVNNARQVMAMEGEFVPLLWSFVNDAPQQNAYESMKGVPSETDASRNMARALKKIGFRFVGPTTCYAFMQSAGMVNDHLITCPAFERCGTIAASWTL